jgi:uncharacterized protein
MEQDNHIAVEFLRYFVSTVADKPDDVRINFKKDEMGTLISLYVAEEDMGKIIGKEGKTAKAIRIMLRVIGSKQNEKISLEIPSPEHR